MNHTAKILQRFYRNYIKWPKSLNHENLLWPVDLIMNEPFDPTYKLRILITTSSKLAGAKHKLELFNIGSLWQSLYISDSIESPISTQKFTEEQFNKIAEFAYTCNIATRAQINSFKNKHYVNTTIPSINAPPFEIPNVLTAEQLQEIQEIINHQYDIIIAGINGDNKRVVDLILLHGADISSDRFLPNKFYTFDAINDYTTLHQIQPLGLTLGLPLTNINAIMAIAYGCNIDTFIEAIQNGFDVKLHNNEGYTACHMAAYTANIDILLQLIHVYNWDLADETNNSASILSIIDKHEDASTIYEMLFQGGPTVSFYPLPGASP